MRDLKGKVTFVTGGGAGLGEAICRTLAESGASVVVADVRGEKAEAVAAALREQGHQAMPLSLDVSDPRQAEEAIRRVMDHFGRLDVLVNNAGVDVTQSVEEVSVADWSRVVDVNLRGPFLMAKFAFPVMKAQGAGHIVNIASTASRRAWPNASAYHASKWGLLGLSHALHVEGRPLKIKVTAVLSGGMRTPFILERFPDTPLEVLQDASNVADTVRYVLMQPEDTVIPEIMVLPMRETSWP